MSDKDNVDRLVKLLEAVPEITGVKVDGPREKPTGNWAVGGSCFIDCTTGTQGFVVEYRPTVGYGLSSVPSDGFGCGPDEVYQDNEEAVVARIRELIRTKTRTIDPTTGKPSV